MAGTNTTYSAGDVSCTMQHPLVGQRCINGSGMGSVSISYTDNLTESDQGADGSVMITKILSRRGIITLDIQQTSSTNKWLHNYANVVDNASSSEWAKGSMRIAENFENGLVTTASSLAIVKRPDRKDEQNGGHVTWEFFSPNIVTA